MKTLKVRLKCQWDNGERILPPETETELDRDQAFSLADMGMVEIIPEEVPAKPIKPSTATKPAAARAKPKKADVAKPKKGQEAKTAEPASSAEDSDNDSDDAENENQDSENDSAGSDNEIPDPDSLVEQP